MYFLTFFFFSLATNLFCWYSEWASIFFFLIDFVFSVSVISVPISILLFAAAKSLQSCLTLWSHRRQPTRLPCPWGSPGKNSGVGCHFLLQCVKVKRESEVVQSCPTLSDPMDCSLPHSSVSVHGIFQARVLEWGAIAFSDFFFCCFCLLCILFAFDLLES